jgi:hypothetical protein
MTKATRLTFVAGDGYSVLLKNADMEGLGLLLAHENMGRKTPGEKIALLEKHGGRLFECMTLTLDGKQNDGPGGEPAHRQWLEDGTLMCAEHFRDGLHETGLKGEFAKAIYHLNGRLHMGLHSRAGEECNGPDGTLMQVFNEQGTLLGGSRLNPRGQIVPMDRKRCIAVLQQHKLGLVLIRSDAS